MTRHEGTPQGGPLSPLLANILLDDPDKVLERRGLRFCRYAIKRSHLSEPPYAEYARTVVWEAGKVTTRPTRSVVLQMYLLTILTLRSRSATIPELGFCPGSASGVTPMRWS